MNLTRDLVRPTAKTTTPTTNSRNEVDCASSSHLYAPNSLLLEEECRVTRGCIRRQRSTRINSWSVLFSKCYPLPYKSISPAGLSSNIEELSVAINQWSGRFEVVRGTQTYLFVDTLKAHSQRSDCFKEASVALYESCESLEFDLDARVKGELGLYNHILSLT